MPARNPDLHGNVPDESAVALLIVDMINDLEFVGGEELVKYAVPAAKRIAELKKRAKEAGVAVIYANDNFGRWRSDFKAQIEHVLNDGVRGQPLAEILKPEDDDYFVLKPKHSVFFATVLDVLLAYLKTKLLIITGVAGNICIHYSCNDAYLRDYLLVVPQDCIASNDPRDNEAALEQMNKLLKADTRPSPELDFEELKERANQGEKQHKGEGQEQKGGNSQFQEPEPQQMPKGQEVLNS